MLTVHGRITSSNVQPVVWTLEELGVPYRRLDVGGAYGGNHTPEYLAMNPNGLVPVIQDGPVTMFESPAIVRYLGARYGAGSFWPEDPAVRGPIDTWAEWGRQSFYTALSPLFGQLVRTRPAARDPGVIAKAAERMREVVTILDARIGQGPWLAGETFTFADVMVGHLLYRYHELDFPRAELPSLSAYYVRLCERPAYREHVCVSFESLRPA